MCAVEVDLAWITPQLAVGACIPEGGLAALKALGIRRVVDVRVEEKDDEELLRSHGVTLLHLPTIDRCAVIPDMLEQGVQWIHEELKAGEKVLVHCQHGIGRSALVCLCVLVVQGMPPDRALLLAKNAREKVSPSPEQLTAFLSFCERHQLKAGSRWPLPDLETLMRIAYRHLAKQQERFDG